MDSRVMRNAGGHLKQPEIGEIKEGTIEYFLKAIKSLNDTTWDSASVQFRQVREREILLSEAANVLRLALEQVETTNKAKLVQTPEFVERQIKDILEKLNGRG